MNPIVQVIVVLLFGIFVGWCVSGIMYVFFPHLWDEMVYATDIIQSFVSRFYKKLKAGSKDEPRNKMDF